MASSPGTGGIVIVGAGLAGLFTALKLAPLPVTVIAGAPLGEGASSSWAQGGIAAAVGEGDTTEAHARDTIAAGAGIVDEAVARMVAGEAPDRIRDLLRYGVPFDRDLEGHFVLSREAAHSAKRIVRVSGDRAGAAIMQALIATVRQTPSVRIMEGYEAVGVSAPRAGAGRVVNAIRMDAAAGVDISAEAVILATGGVGQLYAVTTNPANSRGQGIAMAARAGACIGDPEFVQFHPTAIDVGIDPAPLASEALRGEGAFLVNRAGHRFMVDQHADADLAPRDIVARGVFREIAAGRGAYLDCRTAIGKHFAQAFPTIYAHCHRAGIDPAVDLIPVAPAEHFHMGGVETDVNGRSSVRGLWAVGEVAATGMHGANRLASNSLLEAVVFGARVAADVESSIGAPATARVDERPVPAGSGWTVTTSANPAAAGDLAARIRRTTTLLVGVERTAEGLRSALRELDDIKGRSTGVPRIFDMATTAEFITAAALKREESRGGHYRTDFPEPRPELAMRSRWSSDDVLAVKREVMPERFKEEPLS